MAGVGDDRRRCAAPTTCRRWSRRSRRPARRRRSAGAAWRARRRRTPAPPRRAPGRRSPPRRDGADRVAGRGDRHQPGARPDQVGVLADGQLAGGRRRTPPTARSRRPRSAACTQGRTLASWSSRETTTSSPGRQAWPACGRRCRSAPVALGPNTTPAGSPPTRSATASRAAATISPDRRAGLEGRAPVADGGAQRAGDGVGDRRGDQRAGRAVEVARTLGEGGIGGPDPGDVDAHASEASPRRRARSGDVLRPSPGCCGWTPRATGRRPIPVG